MYKVFFLSLALTSCMIDNDLVLSSAPTVASASIAPGLTDGCNEAGPTLGRFLGRVYTLPIDTRRLPDFNTLETSGSVCLDQLDVSERNGYPSFPGLRNRTTWIGVDIIGAFTVTTPGAYEFRLTSDDGSKLIIDGTSIIDNDGYHTTRVVTGAAQLSAGTHTIEIPYWQGPGPLALILEIARPNQPFEVFHVDRPL